MTITLLRAVADCPAILSESDVVEQQLLIVNPFWNYLDDMLYRINRIRAGEIGGELSEIEELLEDALPHVLSIISDHQRHLRARYDILRNQVAQQTRSRAQLNIAQTALLCPLRTAETTESELTRQVNDLQTALLNAQDEAAAARNELRAVEERERQGRALRDAPPPLFSITHPWETPTAETGRAATYTTYTTTQMDTHQRLWNDFPLNITAEMNRLRGQMTQLRTQADEIHITVDTNTVPITDTGEPEPHATPVQPDGGHPEATRVDNAGNEAE